MRGFKGLWSNRPFPTPDTAGNHGGIRGGYDVGEKETGDSLGAKVTTVTVSGGSPSTTSGPAESNKPKGY